MGADIVGPPYSFGCIFPPTGITLEMAVVIGHVYKKGEWLSVIDKYLGEMLAKMPGCPPLDVESAQM